MSLRTTPLHIADLFKQSGLPCQQDHIVRVRIRVRVEESGLTGLIRKGLNNKKSPRVTKTVGVILL